MGNPRRVWAVVSTLVILMAGSARAQSRKPEAEALFNEGKALMAKGEIDAACEKFEASKDYDPRASTLMNLGACREQQKKLVSAWYAFLEAGKLAAGSTDETGLEVPAKKRAAALVPRLSTMTIVVSAGARVPGLTIMRDGVPILAGQWNSATPVDGGEYTIVARASGTDAWTNTVAVASEHDAKTVEIPVLQPIEPGPGPGLGAVEPTEATSSPTEPVDADRADHRPVRPSGGITGMRKAAIGVGVAGIVALGAGAVFGTKANGKQEDSNRICPGMVCNDPDGLRLNDEAQAAATKANVLFVGGGLAVVGSAVLWVLGAPGPLTPTVDGDTVGIAIRGGF